jgi:3-hydroxyisobutyrate dehydrogenase
VRAAVLGIGIIGAAVARNLLRAGHEVVVWNRTRAKAEPLAGEGAEVVETPAEAAVEPTMSGRDGALGAMREDAAWLQMSTVGVEAIERALQLAEEAGVTLVDAPVVGTKEPAEKGELLVLASGPDEALDRCEPIFEAIGRKTLRLGEVGRGSAFKLVLNTWLIGIVESLAETIGLARALGFEPELFLETIAGGPLDSGYAQLKGKAMVQDEFPPSFPLRLAQKDAGLVLQAAEAAGLDLPAVEAALGQLERAQELGLGEEDMAAVARVARPGVEQGT